MNTNKTSEDIRKALILRALGFDNAKEVDRLYTLRDKQSKKQNKGEK